MLCLAAYRGLIEQRRKQSICYTATVIIIVAGISKKKMKNSGFKSNDDLSSKIYYTFFNISNPNNGTSFKERRYIVNEFLIANFV